MAAKTIVTVAQVREWAASNGHTMKERGRLHGDIIAAYNKNHKNKYDTAVKPEGGTKIQVKGKRKTETGRTVPFSKTVSTVEIRKAAIDAGIPLGQRGRLPQDVIQSYADNTLDDLAAGWQTRTDKMLERRATGFQVLASDALAEDEVSEEQDSEQYVMLDEPAEDETVSITV